MTYTMGKGVGKYHRGSYIVPKISRTLAYKRLKIEPEF